MLGCTPWTERLAGPTQGPGKRIMARRPVASGSRPGAWAPRRPARRRGSPTSTTLPRRPPLVSGCELRCCILQVLVGHAHRRRLMPIMLCPAATTRARRWSSATAAAGVAHDYDTAGRHEAPHGLEPGGCWSAAAWCGAALPRNRNWGRSSWKLRSVLPVQSPCGGTAGDPYLPPRPEDSMASTCHMRCARA